MKYYVVGIMCAVWLPIMVQAYIVSDTIVTKPYEVVPFEYDIDDTVVRIGSLDGYPVMYEFTTERTIDLEIQLLQRYYGPGAEPVQLSLIAVRVTDNGVAEVGRLQIGGEADWQVQAYPRLGVTALASDVFAATIEPGTYRVEVSTPNNSGRYALLVGGETPPMSYFETLSAIRTVQGGLGYSVFYMLTSSYVYYPIGIVLLLFGIHRTWKLRYKISHQHDT